MEDRAAPPRRHLAQSRLAQIGEAGQARISRGRVTIVGVGALGCVQAAYLARSGVGSIRLVDRDIVEEGNLQRQILFDEDDAAEGIPKAQAALRSLARIDRRIALDAVVAHLDARNAREIISGSDLVLDGTDNFDTRFLINDVSIELRIPWIYGACLGTEGIVAPIVPGRTACLRCLLAPDVAGGDPTCESAGILASVAGIVGSLQASAALRCLVEGETWEPWGAIQVEAWSGALRSLAPARPDPGCLACARKQLEFLEGGRGGSLEVLCGSEAVQILPSSRAARNLEAAARELSRIGEVRRTPFLLQARLQGHTLSIFPDGRVIVFGTRDPRRARTLVDRYLEGF
jgi:molybdopterin/thiamine biosynthesis adenylyltransferase